MDPHLGELRAERLTGVVQQHAGQHIDHADLAVALDRLAAMAPDQRSVIFRTRRIVERTNLPVGNAELLELQPVQRRAPVAHGEPAEFLAHFLSGERDRRGNTRRTRRTTRHTRCREAVVTEIEAEAARRMARRAHRARRHVIERNHRLLHFDLLAGVELVRLATRGFAIVDVDGRRVVRFVANALQPPRVVGAEGDVPDQSGPVADAVEHLLARQHQLDRSAGGHRRHARDRLMRPERTLAAEGPADEPAGQHHVLRLEPQRLGVLLRGGDDRLRRFLNGQGVTVAEHGHRARLHRVVVLGGHPIGVGENHFGTRKCLARITAFFGNLLVILRSRIVTFVEQRVEIELGGLLVVVHDHPPRGVLGGFPRVGEDAADEPAVVEDLVRLERQKGFALRAADDVLGFAQAPGILEGQDLDDTRHRACRGQVEGSDCAARDRRLDQHGVQQSVRRVVA